MSDKRDSGIGYWVWMVRVNGNYPAAPAQYSLITHYLSAGRQAHYL